ncbi:hypothetical protein DTO280E4_9044 [Paecilomyces variotii]|nr:hypothetical protein DTO280E4_9044 [Paecilomyces variotii]
MLSVRKNGGAAVQTLLFGESAGKVPDVGRKGRQQETPPGQEDPMMAESERRRGQPPMPLSRTSRTLSQPVSSVTMISWTAKISWRVETVHTGTQSVRSPISP